MKHSMETSPINKELFSLLRLYNHMKAPPNATIIKLLQASDVIMLCRTAVRFARTCPNCADGIPCCKACISFDEINEEKKTPGINANSRETPPVNPRLI